MSDESANCGWRLDERYGFQLAFFRKDLRPPSASFFSVSPRKGVPANEPDIDNLVLYEFLNRGFLPKVEARSKDQNLYLKLFEFPKSISPEESYKKILEKFSLTKKMEQSQDFQDSSPKADNILVKFGWIALRSNDFASRPFPRFLIPQDSQEVAQVHFDGHLPFSSLYVSPTKKAKPGLSEEQLIEHSRKGVSAFHNELFNIYCGPGFQEIKTDDHSSMFVKKPDDDRAKTGRISVIWLKQLEFVKDVRDRPMPLDRDHDFLSSLLLVHYTDFIPDKDDLPDPLTKEDLDREWRPELDSHHILEIASVVRLEKRKAAQ